MARFLTYGQLKWTRIGSWITCKNKKTGQIKKMQKLGNCKFALDVPTPNAPCFLNDNGSWLFLHTLVENFTEFEHAPDPFYTTIWHPSIELPKLAPGTKIFCRLARTNRPFIFIKSKTLAYYWDEADRRIITCDDLARQYKGFMKCLPQGNQPIMLNEQPTNLLPVGKTPKIKYKITRHDHMVIMSLYYIDMERFSGTLKKLPGCVTIEKEIIKGQRTGGSLWSFLIMAGSVDNATQSHCYTHIADAKSAEFELKNWILELANNPDNWKNREITPVLFGIPEDAVSLF